MSDKNENRSSFPFDLPPEEEEEVFSSVEEADRGEADARGTDSDVLSSTGDFPRPPDGKPGSVSVGASTSGQFSSVGGSDSSPSEAPSSVAAPAVTGQPVLVVEEPTARSSRAVDLNQPRFQIGRDRGDLPLEDPFVSPWHVQLRDDDGRLLLEDMGSANGVFLRIADELVLEDRDEIVVGHQRLLFRTRWDDHDRPEAAGENVSVPGGPRPGDPARIIRFYEGGDVAGVHHVGDRLTIGRSDCDLVSPSDPLLSSPHAVIRRTGASFSIRDEQTRFGTFIRIHDPVELIDGDCFLIGRTRIELAYP